MADADADADDSTLPSRPSLRFDTSSTFLTSYTTSPHPPPTPPPNSFTLLSDASPSPAVPPSFPAPNLIPSTRFVVDAFRPAGDFSVSYFLSHFHSDHYAGLNPTWRRGLVFCSHLTARLLLHSLHVPPPFVVPLPIGEAVVIDGWEVTLVDANHCPGAVMFLFRSRTDKEESYVHTGDFRFSESMKSDSNICKFVGADAVFLDTTYCNPRYEFPPQIESIGYIVDTIDRIRAENANDPKMRVLFLVATYVVGKERILLEIARRCDCMVCVDDKKMAILRAIDLGDIGVFTEEEGKSDVHVIGWNLLGETWPYFRPNYVKMKEIMEKKGYSRAVGFVPTGWMYETKLKGFSVRAKDQFEIHLVPYSEHSSYSELREFVKFLRPKQVIPTVGLDVEKLDSKMVVAMKKHFAGLIDEKALKQDFLMGFHRKSANFAPKNADASKCVEGGMLVHGNAEHLGEMHVHGNAEQPSEHSEHALVDPADQKHASGGNSCSRECNMQKREAFDKVTHELRECLPPWVTLDQVFDLIYKSDGDVVGAVTEFYERETELFDQLSENSVSDFTSQPPSTVVGSVQDIVPALSPSKVSKQLSKHHPVKDGTSISRKDVSPVINSKRKLKQSPSSSFGPKQSTITSFFGKHLQKSSHSGSSGCFAADECLAGGIEKGESHVDVLNSFMKITGENVTESEASAILKSAKGNLNVALDIYYDNFESRCNIPEKLNVKNVETQLVASADCNKKQKRMMDVDVTCRNEPLTSDMNASRVQLPLEKFSPIDDACWRVGQPAPYLHLAHTFDLLERERGKIKATSMLCNMFRSLLALSPEDVLPAVYLCSNRIAAEHMNVELNVGGSLVSTAIEEVCGTNKSRIRELYNKLGDLGDVAQHCRQTQSLLVSPCPLTIRELFSTLRKISKEAGNGSVTRKKSLIVKLMRSCRAKEIKFFVRTLVKNMRIGAMLRTILPSLAQAVVLNSCQNLQGQRDEYLKRQLQAISEAVIQAYNILPSLDLVVPSLLSKGIDFSSSSLSMTPGVPIKPMLARITNGVDQVLNLFQGKAFTCEYKYDGQRAQIHKLTDGSVRVFSRNGEETTCRFPDLVDIITGCLAQDCETCILDSEVVAIDRINGNKLLPFQKLSSRERGGRDSVVLVANIKVDICVFVFDVMLYNGQQLLMTPLRQRRKFLSKLFNGEKEGYFEFAKEVTVEADGSTLSEKATLSKINSFLEDAWDSSSEGIIVKTLDVDAGYAPSKRADTWLKVKRDYVDGMGDSLDLVPVGAWYGNGRKAGWYSPFLMACYNPEAEEYQSVCRVMSGFSDSFYSEMKEFYSGEKLLSKKPVYYQTAEVPDVWFSPELVWEIRGASTSLYL